MVLACLVVFAAIVTADYFVQRKPARDALALAQATPTPTLTPTPSPTPIPTTTVTATPDPPEEIVEGAAAASPTQPDLEKYLDSPTPTPKPTPSIPNFDDGVQKKRNNAKE